MKKRIEFPLVEFLLLIILLFVLVIFAMPKFLDVGSGARIEALNATALNISSVNRMLYSRAAIKNVQNSALQSTDVFGADEAGAYLVYGELRAQQADLELYISNVLIGYESTGRAGELRLFFENYKSEACYIIYYQPSLYTDLSGNFSIKKAFYRVKSTGC
ncbi:MAG: hypothetical protein GY951_00715 [Psychromonas sp.]|nr:hypothetical protein [Alteromonadales bacterium]MCP5076570.1 hypothetical protein [Psychromonas sp.]